MANTRTFLINARNRHTVYVNRYATGQTKALLPYLNKAKKQVLVLLLSSQLSPGNRAQYLQLLRDINEALRDTFGKMKQQLVDELVQFTQYEAEFSAKLMNKATQNTEFVVPDPEVLQAAVTGSDLKLGSSTLGIISAVDTFVDNKTNQVLSAVNSGFIDGSNGQEILDSIDNGPVNLAPLQMKALIQTLLTAASTVALDAVLSTTEEKDVLVGYQWVSVLDSATTEQCAALDGEVFGVNDGPRPPLHWNCRSTVIPVIEKQYTVSTLDNTQRTSVGPDGVEPVSATTTYQGWLRSQPASFQDDVLGPTKGALFRQGGLPLSSFVDENHVPYTLDQLRAKEPEAFAKAGL